MKFNFIDIVSRHTNRKDDVVDNKLLMNKLILESHQVPSIPYSNLNTLRENHNH